MKKYFFSILVFIIVTEVGLRITKITQDNSEKKLDNYHYKYKNKRDTHLFTWYPNSVVKHYQKEFKYDNKYNELGHREKSFLEFKNDSISKKIVCIGDSFTEGDGAPYDSTWVRQLEKRINLISTEKYSFYNAGVCGSDVFYNFTMLKEKLLVTKPSIVIECINSSDIHDVIYRGGKERFNTDGTTSCKSGPNWEFFYKYSYFFRAIIRTVGGYNSNLIKRKLAELKTKEAISKIKNQIYKTEHFCKLNNIEYILIILPTPNEIVHNAENYLSFKSEINQINLFKILKKHFGIKNINNYYWKINGHYNGKGYLEIGDVIYEEMNEFNLTKNE